MPKTVTQGAGEALSEPSEAPQSAQNALAVPRAGGALALPPEWLAELQKEAKDEAAKERPSISKISLRAGQMSFMGNPVKDNKMEVVIMVAANRNAFYPDKFNPNEIKNPTCFAVADDKDLLEAHENVPDENVGPRRDEDGHSRACDNCQYSEWGSNLEGGRGKACKEGRRIIILPGDALVSAESALKAEMAIIDIPVTSVKNWANYVNALSASVGVPAWACVSEISTRPDAKTQFQVNFQPMRVIPDTEVLGALRKRRDEALRIALTPWDEAALLGQDDKKKEPAKGKKF